MFSSRGGRSSSIGLCVCKQMPTLSQRPLLSLGPSSFAVMLALALPCHMQSTALRNKITDGQERGKLMRTKFSCFCDWCIHNAPGP